MFKIRLMYKKRLTSFDIWLCGDLFRVSLLDNKSKWEKKKKKKERNKLELGGCLYVRNNNFQQIVYSYRDCPLTWERMVALIND